MKRGGFTRRMEGGPLGLKKTEDKGKKDKEGRDQSKGSGGGKKGTQKKSPPSRGGRVISSVSAGVQGRGRGGNEG